MQPELIQALKRNRGSANDYIELMRQAYWGTVALWPMDGGGQDRTGAYNLTEPGGVAFGVPGPALNGEAALAAKFNGTSGYLTRAGEPLKAVSATVCTLAFWSNIKVADLGGTYKFLYDNSKGNLTTNKGITAFFDGRVNPNNFTGTNLFCFGTGTTTAQTCRFCAASIVPADGLFHHYAAVYNGATIAFYFDGQARTTLISSLAGYGGTGNIVNNTNQLDIGRVSESATALFPAGCSMMQVCNIAWSAAQAQQAYEAAIGRGL